MKVVVLGGGPGGYVAAIRAAQLGGDVTLIEKSNLGGTCLNVGCIPTKALLQSAKLLHELKESDKFGIEVKGNVEVNWAKVQSRKKTVVNTLVSGVKGLLSINKVKVINGLGKFESKNSISVTSEDGNTQKVEFDNVIIASGSLPFIPPIEGKDLEGVMDSTDALSLKNIPKSMVIIGGGVIGVEFASVYSAFGCKVHIVEMLPFLLPPIDRELGEMVKVNLISEGIDIYNDCKVTKIEKANENLNVAFSKGTEQLNIEAEKVLVAVGRRANIKNLDLDKSGVKIEKGCIVVNDNMETNVAGIYAIGDCNGKNMLAHVASEQGIVAAERIMGKNSKMDYKTVPACVYIRPELASVGLTEEQVKTSGVPYRVGKFPLAANGKALIMGETSGVIKIIADVNYDEILGVHILGPGATDIITEAALALRLECTIEELITTIHAHPTVGEAMREAALAVNKQAIHIPNK
ncbi:dihydrolipoyl dehydrogenase [Clostridium sp.]|uniref:dihydrolipoyl dehydrogenase n=1 Tax=Clostridium sp. TaxID=1506 RepID=UPI001A598B51|nr:dihydrolipoyl dehydrogenase [Clostridium sp.]MBK5236094.1 dihydrolipoyl dehydrogenase [Clostridium sp.]